ncbi:MAG TPA: hypothetical protein VLE27_15560 [Thermoanaerobaculia bacterium]|nr:hypothetical protein [Thermoanaerobaculia bacterium]
MRHIHPLQPIILIILIVAMYYFRKQQKAKDGGAAAGPGEPRAAISRPKEPKEAKSPEAVYMDLRQKALQRMPGSLDVELQENQPYGLVMEMDMSSSVVTLACFADGDAGVYYKTGGGMKGGIGHETVRNASREAIALTESVLPRMIQTTNFPLPGADRVRFYVLTPKGIFTTETSRQSLSEQSALSPLFYAGQEVVSQMRLVQEQKAGAVPVPA